MLDDDLFHDLPTTLLSDMKARNLDMLTKVPFFSKEVRSAYFLKCVSDALESRVYAPGAYLMYQSGCEQFE